MNARKQPLTYEEFKNIYSKVPRLCVEVVIKTEQGVLLALRKEHGWENLWHIPGGTVHYREHVMDAVKRVAREEVHTEVSIKQALGYIEFMNEEHDRGFGYSVGISFLCEILDKNFEIKNPEEIQFFSKLPENTIAEHRNFLKEKFGIV